MTEPAMSARRASRQAPEVRRQALLDVTISCLAQLGPRATTGREICRRAGVSHGLLRHYFANPNNLLLETYQELCDRFIARLEGELGAPEHGAQPDPFDALDRFFAAQFADEWASSDMLGAWMAFWALVRTNEEFAATSEAFNLRVRALLRTAVSRLPVGPDVSKDDVATILSAVMDGLWLDYCLSPDRTPRDQARSLCSLTLRQLVPVPTAEETA
jgi:AcrR family transcriptional regulator